MTTETSGLLARTPTAPLLPASYIPGLDGMRAVSVLLVIIGHAGFTLVPGALGVTVFFFLSGFLITNLLVTEYDRNGNINVKDFYIRRYLRLMPEQGFYVIVGLLIGALIGSIPGIINTIGALFYFTNYIKIFQLGHGVSPFTTGHFWSLAVEEHFYLTWPLAMLAALPSYRRLIFVIGGIIVACLAWRIFIVTCTDFPEHYVYYASEARFDSIAFGAACAVLFRKFPWVVQILGRHANAILCAGVVILLIPITWRTVFGLNQTFQEAVRYTVQGIGFILCFIYLYGSPLSKLQQLAMKILELPIMSFIGRSSYGAYIWHYCLINTFTALVGSVSPEAMPLPMKIVCAVLAVPLSVLLGYASSKLVLGPFSKLRRRFGSHVPSSHVSSVELTSRI